MTRLNRLRQDERGRFPYEILILIVFGIGMLHGLISASNDLGGKVGHQTGDSFDPIENAKNFAWSLFKAN
ncbi:MAG: hypothetical protein KDD66_06780 [Bdellovibrionales bacterium]|nr:hypothetical protein [Bdellovibrionales bacterium]